MPHTRRLTSTTAAAALAAIVLVAALWLAVDRLAGGGDGPELVGGEAIVVEVVDGDTLVADVGGDRETIRLLGIDTPETHHPTKPVECYGAEASARLAELAPRGATIRLERDVEARDHYGRLLVYVFVGADGGDDATSVNQVLVTEGYAVALPVEPNRALRNRLAAAEHEARSHHLGLWGACGGPGVAVDAVTGR